jgi:hypothetical protein
MPTLPGRGCPGCSTSARSAVRGRAARRARAGWPTSAARFGGWCPGPSPRWSAMWLATRSSRRGQRGDAGRHRCRSWAPPSRALDRRSPQPSVVSGPRNAVTARLPRLVPRRTTIAVTRRVMTANARPRLALRPCSLSDVDGLSHTCGPNAPSRPPPTPARGPGPLVRGRPAGSTATAARPGWLAGPGRGQHPCHPHGLDACGVLNGDPQWRSSLQCCWRGTPSAGQGASATGAGRGRQLT